MLNYLNTHPEEFRSVFYPYLIAMMQCTGGFIAELTNLFMLSTRVTVEYCITFFVAFHVLAEIDNIYAEAMADFELKETIEEPLKFKQSPGEIGWKRRSFFNKLIRLQCIILNVLYASFYYYFLPFLVNFVPYLSPGGLKEGKYKKLAKYAAYDRLHTEGYSLTLK